MGTNAGAVPCLLTPIPKTVHRFTAKPGTLKLVVAQVKGHTDLNCVTSKVVEITGGAQTAVAHTCDSSSFSFEMKSGKRYFLALAFVQLVDPFEARANLNEACGQTVDIIDATNLLPGYFIEVA